MWASAWARQRAKCAWGKTASTVPSSLCGVSNRVRPSPSSGAHGRCSHTEADTSASTLSGSSLITSSGSLISHPPTPGRGSPRNTRNTRKEETDNKRDEEVGGGMIQLLSFHSFPLVVILSSFLVFVCFVCFVVQL